MTAWPLSVGRVILILLLGGLGVAKFTSGEAQAIRPLLETSPVFAWALRSFGLTSTSAAIGVIEISIASLLVVGCRRAWPALIGSALATATFVTTLSFLVTTPTDKLPFPPAFLYKDVLLLIVAAISTYEAGLRASIALAASGPPRKV